MCTQYINNDTDEQVRAHRYGADTISSRLLLKKAFVSPHTSADLHKRAALIPGPPQRDGEQQH